MFITRRRASSSFSPVSFFFFFIWARNSGGSLDVDFFAGGTVAGPPPTLTEVVPPSSSFTIKCLICLSDIPLAIVAEAVPAFGLPLPFLIACAMRAAVCCLSDLAGIGLLRRRVIGFRFFRGGFFRQGRIP